MLLRRLLGFTESTSPGRRRSARWGAADRRESCEDLVLMQFDLWFGAPRDDARYCVKCDLDEAMKLVLVHLVERHIHEAREIALNEKVSANERAHQAPDRAVLAKRHQ